MEDAIEQETKLSAPNDLRLPEFDRVLPGITAERLPDQDLSAVYLDTPDLLLARSAITLRKRTETSESESREVWTLKLPDPPGGIGLAKRELNWPAKGDEPPKPALKLVRAASFGLPLQPVARLDAKRRRVGMRDLDGADVAEIVDDEVVVVDGDVPDRFREIDVELTREAPEGLMDVLVDRLVETGAETDGAEPEVVRALGPLCHEPPDTQPPDLSAGSTTRDVVASAIARALTAMLDHDPGLRLGGDIEHVHKARVATRRLRSDLRMLRPLLDRAWGRRVRKDLRWAADALGKVRDADVLCTLLTADRAALPEADRAAAQVLLDKLAKQRDGANRRLRRVLDSKRYLGLLNDLRAAVLEPPFAAGVSGDDPACDVLPGLVRRAWKKVKRPAKALGSDPPDAALHEVRKRAKALRYAAESAAPVIGKPAARLARKAEKVQDVLGELQDAVVAEAWLREHAMQDPAQALVAGELIARHRAQQLDSRASWPKALKKLRRKKLRAWLQA